MAGDDDTMVSLPRDHMLLVATGEDRTRFLHGMLSNAVEGLAPGHGAPALLLSEQGRITASLALMVDAEEILLDLSTAAAERLLAVLERFIVADDIEFLQRPVFLLRLEGKDAAATLAKVVEAMPALAPGAHQQVQLADVSVRLARGDGLVKDVYKIFCDDALSADLLVAALVAAGARVLSEESAEARRIGTGVAREGVDFDTATLAPEVPSLAAAISFRKGCYLGQEVVERVAARGKVRWLVTRVTLSGAAPVGARLLVAGKEVGALSSVAAPAQDGTIAAMARVRRENVEEESSVEVVWDGGSVRGAVVAMAAAAPEE
ncbi:MAG: hypothetical protein VCC00_13160 [Deltaproteobacteria bacterium]